MCGCNSNFDGELENFSNYDGGDFDTENGLYDFDGDVENFDEEFLLKLADNWEEPIDEDSDRDYMQLYWDHYALGDGLDPENVMAIQKLAADKASEYGKKLEGLIVRQGRDLMMYRKLDQLRKELTFK